MKTLSSSPSTTKKKERKKKCDHETCRQASKTAGFMVHITVGEVTKVICGSKILQTLFFFNRALKANVSHPGWSSGWRERLVQHPQVF
jgi:hypothetical protein